MGLRKTHWFCIYYYRHDLALKSFAVDAMREMIQRVICGCREYLMEVLDFVSNFQVKQEKHVKDGFREC